VPADVDDTKAALDALLGRIRAAGHDVVAQGAAALAGAGMARTHVRSGTLRRSWRAEVQGLTAEVGPTTVYARRQELGFHGPDSLGRIFTHDPGWPYVRPTFEATGPKIRALAVSRLAEAIGG
jgi:Bacteriophage HK97-gp10, putative tail-component